MAAQAGKIVITSALSGTYLRQGFNSILDLIPKAEKIKQLHAICKLCHFQASFTLRTVEETNVELVGGQEAYMPVCRECFIFKSHEQEQAKQAAQNKLTEINFDEDGQKLLSIQKSDASEKTNISAASSGAGSSGKQMSSPLVLEYKQGNSADKDGPSIPFLEETPEQLKK